MPRMPQRNCRQVLLVDDHPLVRQALREAISREGDLAVCGEAEDRDGTFAAIEASRPDMAIVDLGLKNSSGMQLIEDIHDRHPQMPTLVLSMHDESLYAERSIRAGASGYISKQEPPEKIMQAVRKVLAGEIYWSERAAAQVASRVARSVRRVSGSPMDLLSERELQVFELIGSGASASAIASMLYIAMSTVESYRARIKEKMNLRDAQELLQAGIRWNVAKGSICELQPAKGPSKQLQIGYGRRQWK